MAFESAQFSRRALALIDSHFDTFRRVSQAMPAHSLQAQTGIIISDCLIFHISPGFAALTLSRFWGVIWLQWRLEV
jgi:hypothetical protein